MYKFEVVVNASYLDDETRPKDIAAVLTTIAEEIKYRDANLKDQVASVGEYIRWDIKTTDKDVD